MIALQKVNNFLVTQERRCFLREVLPKVMDLEKIIRDGMFTDIVIFILSPGASPVCNMLHGRRANTMYEGSCSS